MAPSGMGIGASARPDSLPTAPKSTSTGISARPYCLPTELKSINIGLSETTLMAKLKTRSWNIFKVAKCEFSRQKLQLRDVDTCIVLGEHITTSLCAVVRRTHHGTTFRCWLGLGSSWQAYVALN